MILITVIKIIMIQQIWFFGHINPKAFGPINKKEGVSIRVWGAAIRVLGTAMSTWYVVYYIGFWNHY